MGDQRGPSLTRSSIARPLGPYGSISNLQTGPLGQPQGISVVGEAKTTATPDLALLYIGVASVESTVEQARQRAATAMDAIVSSFKANGVEDRDIKTSYLNITPERRYDKLNGADTIVGYRVSNIVNVKVRQIQNISKVVDDAVAAGGNLARLQNIQFTFDNPASLYSALREGAMQDAKSKGEQLARLSGVGLGAPIYITEGGAPIPFNGYPGLAGGKGGDMSQPSSPTPISPGQSEVRLTVQVVYDIVS